MVRPIIAAVGLVVLLAGCGGNPREGRSCSGEGTGLCSSELEALICESGRFRAIPCRGAVGCIAQRDRFVCDVLAFQGDPCPAASEGSAQCDHLNPDVAFICANGFWEGVSCPVCSVTQGQVTCLSQ